MSQRTHAKISKWTIRNIKLSFAHSTFLLLIKKTKEIEIIHFRKIHTVGDKKYQATIQLSFSFQTKGMYNVHRDSEIRKVEDLENQFVLIFFHSGLNNRRLALLFGVFIRFLVLFFSSGKKCVGVIICTLFACLSSLSAT